VGNLLVKQLESVTLLQAEGLSKLFGELKVLQGVNLEVKTRSIHAVLGHHGAGKTTLMNVLSGVYAPDSGRLLLNGRAVNFGSSDDALRQGISMVHQEPAVVLPGLDVSEHIFQGPKPAVKFDPDTRRELYDRSERLLVELKLSLSPRMPGSTLSVGAWQMIEIARAVAGASKLLILDEPTSALTGREQRRLFELIERLKERGISVLYTTHRASEISEIADTVTVLREGRLVTTIPAREMDDSTLVESIGGESATDKVSSLFPQDKIGFEVIGLSSSEANVWDIVFSARRGEILGLAGISGSGRKRLFECLYGVRAFDHGLIRVRGREVRPNSPAEAMALGIALLPEERQPLGTLSETSGWRNGAMESIRNLFHRVSGPRRERRGRGQTEQAAKPYNDDKNSAEEEIKFFIDGSREKDVPSDQPMRRPHVLLLDDPTAGIDAAAKTEIHSLIRALAKEGVTIILSSSEFPELLSVCDRILAFRNGRIVQEVDPSSATEDSVVAMTTGTDTTRTANEPSLIAETRFPPRWDPYPFGWGTQPIADNPDDAIKWWLARIEDSAVPEDDPSVVLTADEIKELKAMKPKVGHAWYDLSVPAIGGWNKFWKKGVSAWADSVVVYDNHANPDRLRAGAQFLIEQDLLVAGTLSFDWIRSSESMRLFHAAKIATTGVATSPSAYYPPTCTCMTDNISEYRKLVLPTAQLLRAKGYSNVDAVWLVEAHPTWFSISRQMGFKEGLNDPKVQEICKINIIEIKPVLEDADAEATAAAALEKHPNIHLLIMLAHQFKGAAAAVRNAGRRDVWVVASDLDEGTALTLLHGAWPVLITYSLPISGSGYADANVMGKILLGKRVPLIVLSKGTVVTSANVRQASAHDWGGEPLPWQ
jgi:ABC-type sugar transport system ATPase subunit